MRNIRGNQEIEWLYLHSATEMGFSAIDYEALSGGRGSGLTAGLLFQLDAVARACEPAWLSPPVPTDRMVKAAMRQRWYRQALAELSGRHQAVLDQAYEIRDLNGLPDVVNVPSGPRLVADYGLAAPVVRRVLLERRTVEAQCEERIRDAGRNVAQAKRTGTQLDLVAAMAAVTAAKRELVEEQKASGAAADSAAHLLDEALRAYESVRREHRAQAKVELEEARAASSERRQAHLATLLGLPRKQATAAKARLWLQELQSLADNEKTCFRWEEQPFNVFQNGDTVDSAGPEGVYDPQDDPIVAFGDREALFGEGGLLS